MPEKVAGPDDRSFRRERELSALLALVLGACLAHFRGVTVGTNVTVASLLTPYYIWTRLLDPDGRVVLQIVVKAKLSAYLTTVACIPTHWQPEVRLALRHKLHAQLEPCTKLLVRERLGFIVLTILEIRVRRRCLNDPPE